MESAKQAWGLKRVGRWYYFYLGEYELSWIMIEAKGIDWWVRHLEEKRPEFYPLQFKALAESFIDAQKSKKNNGAKASRN